MNSMAIRDAQPQEIEELGRIWHDCWHEAHAHLMPENLTSARNLQNFIERIPALLPDTRVVGPVGEPVGFCILRDDELYQLYVDKRGRGTGVAAALVTDAEERLASQGFMMGWLACAIGNTRAAHFYEKCGWHRAGTVVIQLQIPTGNVAIEVWRYEKALVPGHRPVAQTSG